MNRSQCTRTWQAEAREDGRLLESDLASFERHAVTCELCAAELDTLASLRATMLHLPALTSTPLERRRLRGELLRRVNEPEKSRTPRTFVFAAVAMAAILVFVGTAYFRGHPPSSPTSSVAIQHLEAPAFDVASVDHGVWQSHAEGGVVRTTLTSGTATFHVEHLAVGQRYLVVLPDGEIEVRGTRFVVSVNDGRTSRVEVTEGVVVLRLVGAPERNLHVGERWSLVDVPEEASANAPAAPIASTTSAARDHAVAKTGAGSEASSQGAREVQAPSNDTPPSATTGRFSAAMRAYSAGEYAQADELFARFAADFPDDSRIEDAEFLRALARSRLGDAAGAASLAQAYLAKYPQGLRRREAEQLARGGH